MPKVPTNQGIVNFPDYMTREQINKALADNGLAPEGLLQKAVRVGGEAAQAAGEGYKSLRKTVVESIPSPDMPAGGFMRGMADVMLPETLGQMAGEGALTAIAGPAGKAAAPLLRRAAGVAGRAAVGGGTTAGVDLATGEPTDQALARGAMTGGGALVTGLGGEVSRGVQQNIRKAPQARADTASGLAAVQNVLPAQTAPELYSMVKGEAGQQIASAKYKAMVDALEQAVPGSERALDKISKLKRNARAETRAGTVDVDGPSSQDVADAFEEELMRNISASPTLGPHAKAAMAEYRQHKAVTKFLNESNAFVRGPDEVTLDFRAMQDMLGKPVKGKPGRAWLAELQSSGNQGLVDAIARGDSPAFQDAVYKVSVGSAFANVGPVGVRTPMQGVPLPGLSVPAGKGAVPPRDPRIDTLLGGILGRMTGQSAGFGGR